jgi:flagellar M-ring protein FliF
VAFVQNLQQFIGRLSVAQRVTLGAVVLGVGAVLVGVASWANRPDYALLFGRLDATDAGRVVEALREQGVPYSLREGGTAVYVPEREVYDLRLRLAARGAVSQGPVGYELFDAGTLGMTDFMQKLNYKRALEGELARTVSSVDGVMQARVHLVLPERSPFRDRQVQPSASVVLGLRGGARLDREQVNAVSALVAGAVEGMHVRDVTVLDGRGNLLSDPESGSADAALTSHQLRARRGVEEHLAQGGQSMLDRVLGPGRAVVRVSAQLDHSRTIQERDAIDPESATIISEERQVEPADFGEASSSIRNYELSRTRERQERASGDISYLTVSVVLDYKSAPVRAAADGLPPEPAPYTQAELAEIEALVKNAVGFNPERGDRFAIHQTRFDTSTEDVYATMLQDQERQERLALWLRYGLMALALVLIALVFRSTAKRVASGAEPIRLVARTVESGPSYGGDGAALGSSPASLALPAAEADEDAVVVPDFYTNKLSPEARGRLKAKQALYEEIKSQVNAHPEQTADVLRAWLAADPA